LVSKRPVRGGVKLGSAILWGTFDGAGLEGVDRRRFPDRVAARISSFPEAFPGTAPKLDARKTGPCEIPIGKPFSYAARPTDSRGVRAEATLLQDKAGDLHDVQLNALPLDARMICKGASIHPKRRSRPVLPERNAGKEVRGYAPAVGDAAGATGDHPFGAYAASCPWRMP
jgi:hypothetical protein